MSHPFGDLLLQFRARKRGLSQTRLAHLAGYDPAILARMCAGKKDLTGPSGRDRVVRVIDALHQEGALTTLDEANALLSAADMPPLYDGLPVESALIRKLNPGVEATQVIAQPTPRGPRHNLPAQLTSFVGRADMLADLKGLVSRTRLLTLTGAGGVGKTRLALQLAAGVVDAYADGVWLVELASLTDPALVPQTIGMVLGAHAEPGRPMLATLVDRLRDQELLLLLDNCEHLIEAVACLADALLRGCQAVRILATSRQGLGITGERTWRVPMLQTPEAQGHMGLAELAQVESVRLFVERATLASPAFTLTTHNAPAVRQIVIRLDGMPLAIELAAARVKLLSADDVAARLDDRFRLLTGGSRTALPRQQTLRGAIDWSYDLLGEAERVLFRRLAVFAGGWTLEAAEAVCGGEGIEPDAVLDVLTRLVDQSLVVAVTSAGGVAGLTRFSMLETLRQYAFEKLASAGEEARVRERHLEYLISLGEVVAIQWSGPAPGDPVSQAKRLDLDFDNVRSALDWTAETGRVDDGIHLVEAFYMTLFIVRPVDQELLRRLHQLTAHPAAQRSIRVGRAYLMIGESHFTQSEFEQARVANEQAREIGLALHDHDLLEQADYQLAIQAEERGDYALVRAIFDRLRFDGAIRDDRLMAYGILSLYEGDYAQARALLAEAYTLCHSRTPNKAHTSGRARQLGYALAYLCEHEQATSMLRESLCDNWEMRDERAVAACLSAYGVLAVAQGELRRAARLFGASEALIESIHDGLQYCDRVHFRRNVAELRARLDGITLGAEWAVGRTMTPEQAVAYALSQT